MLLEGEDLQDSFSSAETGQVACTPFYQEIKSCLEFLTQSIVKLRCHLSNMPLVDTERFDSTDGGQVPFARTEMDEEDGFTEKWIRIKDEVLLSRSACKYG